jgi:hypothetical protein
MAELMKECVNAHERCYGGLGAPCPFCEPVWPPRTSDGRFIRFNEPASTPSDDAQPIENIGGPGRTRTCNQTVMSNESDG